MSVSPDYLIDGDYSRPTPVGPPRFSYPFIQNKDKVSAVFEQDFWQTLETYNTPDLSTQYSQAMPDYFLVDETKPVQFMGNLYAFGRTYARVPVPQITFSTIAINKPAPSTIGTSRGTFADYVSSDAGTSLGTAYSYASALFGNNQIYARKAATSAITLPTGGTFTVTYKTSTTAALAYNASDATVAAAINALADVITDGITVTWGSTGNAAFSVAASVQITLTVGTTASRFTVNGASLTTSAASTVFNKINSATSQQVSIAYRCTISGHGFTSSGNLAVSNAGDSTQSFLPYTTHWLVIDANTVATDALATGQTAPVFAGQLIRAYTSGVARIRSRITDTYYLPIVTTGITTAADIPLPAVALSDSALLTLLAGNATGYQDYDAQPLALWMGQIYHQPVIAVDTTNF